MPCVASSVVQLVRAQPHRRLACLALLVLIGTAPVASADLPGGVADPRVCAQVDGIMPTNVVVPEPFPGLVRDMLALSPTFRAQCRRVAEAGHVRIILRLDMRSPHRNSAARAEFTYTETGELLARIDLYLSTNYAPILAHEFEHVIEQIDRIDVPGLARERREAHEIEPGVYETDRADSVEAVVEREMFGRRRPARTPVPSPRAPAPIRAPERR